MIRFKRLFADYHTFTDPVIEAKLNGVAVRAYPSNSKTLRSAPNISFFFIDEADFFEKSEQRELIDSVERYIGKSNPYIAMVSTPNDPDGLFAQIEGYKEKDCVYKRFALDYKIGLPNKRDPDNIYTIEEITRAKASISFDREYDLKYLGNIGNIFSPTDITAISTEAYDLKPNLYATSFMGVDIGFGSSATTLVVSKYEDGLIKVVHAEQIYQGVFENIIDRIIQVQNTHGCVKVFVDGSAVHTVRSLARRFGQIDDFRDVPDEYIDTWTTTRKDIKVIPISFLKKHREMLRTLMVCVSKRTLRIHPDFKELIIALRSATAKDDNYSLDKQKSSYDDLTDGLRLSLCAVKF